MYSSIAVRSWRARRSCSGRALHEPIELIELAGKLLPGLRPRLEEPCVAADHEAAKPGLEVDHELLDPDGRRLDVLRMGFADPRVVHGRHGANQHHEHAGHEHGQHEAGDDHPAGEGHRPHAVGAPRTLVIEFREVVRVERLRKEAVRAGVPRRLLRVRPGAHHEDVRIPRRRFLAKRGQDVKAAHPRQHQVEDDQIRVVLMCEGHGFVSGFCFHEVIAGPDNGPDQ